MFFLIFWLRMGIFFELEEYRAITFPLHHPLDPESAPPGEALSHDALM